MLFPAFKWIATTGSARALAFLRPMGRGFWLEPWRLARDSSGQMLIEVVLAITIFGAVGTAVVLGVRTAHISASLVEDHSIAERLARNQMESVFNQAYKPAESQPVAYDTLAEANACGSSTGYSICAVALELQASDSYEGTVERVVVTVSVEGRAVLVLETLRAN